MELASQILNILTCFAVITGGSIWAIIAYRRRPQFIVGVPPDHREQELKGITSEQIGRPSIFDQFKHRPDCFSVRLPNREKLSELDSQRLFSDRLRCRTVILTPERKALIPIITENYGGRAARDYILGIQILNQDVHIVNVITESLKIGTFYANRLDLVENRDLPLVDHKIVERYDYMDIEQWGDVLFLEGVLEGGMFEMTLLEIKVDSEVNRFVITYSLDCSDGWISKEAYFQGFVVGS